MTILALEFSSPQRSAAVLRRDELRESPLGRSALALSEVIESGATAPLVMIESALCEAKLEREQIDCLAIGLGPGSYTGIRAAISIAQGWQLARAVKLLGISSVECIAAQAQADGLTGEVNIIVDAQREEFYLATYGLTGGCHEIAPLKIVTMAEVRARVDAGGVLIGPEVSRWFPTGKIVFPRAATIAQLAANRTDFLAGEQLAPIYLRETNFIKAPPPRTFS